ncbi:hypothetical protein GGF31_004549 [Allomyces arbusculus]|nr:hypothetical protein GGF31_004549 [Allomyces arbusculus]
MVAPAVLAALRELPLTDTALVVGGDGFLGGHVVEQLLAIRRPDGPPVHVLDLQQRWPDRDHVVYHIGSLLDHDFLVATLKANGITCVVHTASPPHGKSKAFYHSVNVDGTRNLIQAMVEAGVPKLVYTSSSSVVFDGSDLCKADESLLYCDVPLDPYTETKALGEDLVLKSNNLPTNADCPLLTVALRPSGIFGPRDGQTLPGFLDAIASGKSHIVLGNGQNLFDFTYVENVAAAHILAMAKLAKHSGIDGEAFNITNDDPIPFWDFSKRLTHALLPPSDPRVARAGSLHLPRLPMLVLAYLTAFFVWLISPIVHIDPVFTPFRVRVTTATRTFACDKAKERLGYRPLVQLDEALERSIDWIKTVDKWRALWDPEAIRARELAENTVDELVEDMKIKDE